MRQTAARAGVQILVAALATAAGFLAFVPTDFSGVAELGLIAGVGMLIAFVCTLDLPAGRDHPVPPARRAGRGRLSWAAPLDPLVAAWRRPILLVFGVLAVAGVALSPGLAFDSDPLDTKNQNTEAMRTLRDLIDHPLTNPYTIDVLAPNAAAPRRWPRSCATLSTVDNVRQHRQLRAGRISRKKLALIADANTILAPTLTAPAAGGAGHAGRDPAWRPRRGAGADRRRPCRSCRRTIRWRRSPPICSGSDRAGCRADGDQRGADPLPAAAARSAAAWR